MRVSVLPDNALRGKNAHFTRIAAKNRLPTRLPNVTAIKCERAENMTVSMQKISPMSQFTGSDHHGI